MSQPYGAYQRIDSLHGVNTSYQFKLARQNEASNQIFFVGRSDRKRRSCELRDGAVGWRENDLGYHVLTFFATRLSKYEIALDE
jgi:hypothetical protein